MNHKKDLYVLGIETSCDETALRLSKTGRTSSQMS